MPGGKGQRGEALKGAAAGQPGQVVIVDYPSVEAGVEDLILAPTACGICATDVKQVQKGAKDTRFALGHELVGTIKKTSSNQPWKQGQRVAVAPYLPCGECYYCKHGQGALCSHLYEISILPGGLAEEVLIPAELGRRGTFPLPDDLPDETAALAEPLGCVLKGLEDAHFHPGGSLLVIGDGPMGQLAAAAGRAMGADLVIMAGATDHRLLHARKYFADAAIDVTRKNLKDAEKEFLAVEQDGARYPMLLQRARYGLAQVYESLCEVDKARDYYKKVASAEPDSALGQLAQRRHDQIAGQDPERWFAWFEKQVPKTPVAPVSATGQQPSTPFDLEAPAETPNLPSLGGDMKPAPATDAKPEATPEAPPATEPEAKPAAEPEATPAPQPEEKPAPAPEAKPVPEPVLDAKPAEAAPSPAEQPKS